MVLANIVSDNPLDNIFTHDITFILEAKGSELTISIAKKETSMNIPHKQAYNYNLYLKDSVSEYIQLTNKTQEFFDL